jgi:hypothetical protein
MGENYMIKHESKYGGNPYTKRERERERDKHKNLLFSTNVPHPNPHQLLTVSADTQKKNVIESLSPHV